MKCDAFGRADDDGRLSSDALGPARSAKMNGAIAALPAIILMLCAAMALLSPILARIPRKMISATEETGIIYFKMATLRSPRLTLFSETMPTAESWTRA